MEFQWLPGPSCERVPIKIKGAGDQASHLGTMFQETRISDGAALQAHTVHYRHEHMLCVRYLLSNMLCGRYLLSNMFVCKVFFIV